MLPPDSQTESHHFLWFSFDVYCRYRHRCCCCSVLLVCVCFVTFNSRVDIFIWIARANIVFGVCMGIFIYSPHKLPHTHARTHTHTQSYERTRKNRNQNQNIKINWSATSSNIILQQCKWMKFNISSRILAWHFIICSLNSQTYYCSLFTVRGSGTISQQAESKNDFSQKFISIFDINIWNRTFKRWIWLEPNAMTLSPSGNVSVGFGQSRCSPHLPPPKKRIHIISNCYSFFFWHFSTAHSNWLRQNPLNLLN